MTTSAPGWRCCLPTADETTVSLACPLERDAPWLAGRVLDILRQVAGASSDPGRERYAARRRRGAPLLLGEPLLWNGVALVAEASEPLGTGTGEVTLRLPPWAELAERIDESQLWEVTDRLAQEFRAGCGVVSDGRSVGFPDLSDPATTAPRLQSLHLGVLVPPAWLSHLRGGSTVYWGLEGSGLALVLE